jgi:hypothetical protein
VRSRDEKIIARRSGDESHDARGDENLFFHLVAEPDARRAALQSVTEASLCSVQIIDCCDAEHGGTSCEKF